MAEIASVEIGTFMRFAILINTSPYQYQAADTAYFFTGAALRGGHEVVRVFFYHDGVYNANRFNIPPQDEMNIGERWVALGAQYALDLVVCVAAAQRRGVIDSEERIRHGKDGDNLEKGFRISGLGQWVEAMLAADRVMVFGS